MRVVLDTNVAISGLLWHGPPHQLLEHVHSGALTIVTSPALLTELGAVLSRPRFSEILLEAEITADGIVALLAGVAEILDPPPLATPVSRDPDDDAVLALAAAGRVDLIVSGDADLLSLGAHAGIPILGVAAALQLIPPSG